MALATAAARGNGDDDDDDYIAYDDDSDDDDGMPRKPPKKRSTAAKAAAASAAAAAAAAVPGMSMSAPMLGGVGMSGLPQMAMGGGAGGAANAAAAQQLAAAAAASGGSLMIMAADGQILQVSAETAAQLGLTTGVPMMDPSAFAPRPGVASGPRVQRRTNNSNGIKVDDGRIYVPLPLIHQHFSEAVFPVKARANVVVNGKRMRDNAEVWLRRTLNRTRTKGLGNHWLSGLQTVLNPFAGLRLLRVDYKLDEGFDVILTAQGTWGLNPMPKVDAAGGVLDPNAAAAATPAAVAAAKAAAAAMLGPGGKKKEDDESAAALDLLLLSGQAPDGKKKKLTAAERAAAEQAIQAGRDPQEAIKAAAAAAALAAAQPGSAAALQAQMALVLQAGGGVAGADGLGGVVRGHAFLRGVCACFGGGLLACGAGGGVEGLEGRAPRVARQHQSAPC